MKRKAKPQYAVKDGSPLVRMQILIPRKDYEKIVKWTDITSLGQIDLIRPAISEKLLKEEKRLQVKL